MAGARNLNGPASQFAIRTGPFSNVGRPAQGPATFNDLATAYRQLRVTA